MKSKIVCFVLFVLAGSAFAQRQVTVGSKTFLIRGEKVIAFEELGLYAKETDWVEVYFHMTKDSLIVAELQFNNKASTTAEYVYISGMKRSDVDLDNILAVKYDLIKLPDNLLKVVVTAKGEAEVVTTHGWSDSGSLGSIPGTALRIITMDDEQAMEIIKKIKGK